jgi:putative flippase GtrA
MTAEVHKLIKTQRLNYFWGLVEQIFKFMSVGVLNTAIDAATYFLLTRLIPFFAGWEVLVKGISYVVGMINSFFWNRAWTFKSQISMGRSAFLFTLTHVAALGINAGVMAIGLELLHLPEGFAFILATGASFVWNFVLNKWVVFKPPPKPQLQANS